MTNRFLKRPLGLAAALLALVVLLAVGAAVERVEPHRSDAASVDAASLLCFTGGGKGDRPAVPHRMAQTALCPATASNLHPAVLPASPDMPRPSQARSSHAVLPPQACAPPSASYAVAYPRGPPRLA